MPAAVAVPLAIAGAGLVGAGVQAYTGERASRRAARTQERAAQLASDTQLQMFNQSRTDQLPWMQAGGESLGMLMQGMRSGQFDQAYGGPRFQDAGFQDPGAATMDYTPQGFNFSAADMRQADPGYQFRMEEAQKALERGASARGGLLGGRQLRESMGLASNLASQEYGAAYGRARGSYESDRDYGFQSALARAGLQNTNRSFARGAYESDRGFGYGSMQDRINEYYQNQGNRFNRLAALSNTGQVQSQQLGAQGMNLGQILGENMMQGANARASGYIGSANALNQGISQGLGGAQNAYLMYLMQSGKMG
jgi:hypothetical protein